jgi:hypothetical protein
MHFEGVQSLSCSVEVNTARSCTLNSVQLSVKSVYIQIFWDCIAVEVEVHAPYSEGSRFKSQRGNGLY